MGDTERGGKGVFPEGAAPTISATDKVKAPFVDSQSGQLLSSQTLAGVMEFRHLNRGTHIGVGHSRIKVVADQGQSITT